MIIVPFIYMVAWVIFIGAWEKWEKEDYKTG